jgi:hypothetical protein
MESPLALCGGDQAVFNETGVTGNTEIKPIKILYLNLNIEES